MTARQRRSAYRGEVRALPTLQLGRSLVQFVKGDVPEGSRCGRGCDTAATGGRIRAGGDVGSNGIRDGRSQEEEEEEEGVDSKSGGTKKGQLGATFFSVFVVSPWPLRSAVPCPCPAVPQSHEKRAEMASSQQRSRWAAIIGPWVSR